MERLSPVYDFSESPNVHWQKDRTMIQLTRLGGRQFLLNAELIEMVEKTPDSVITMVSGKKYLVQESLEEIQKRVIEYKRQSDPDFVGEKEETE